ncbi:MAG: bifunctional serine/threonine-protein kinase/formylglycine-generating enzyme family protein [Planctomycetota bacterium]
MSHTATRTPRRRRRAPILDLGPEGPLLEIQGELGKGGMGTVWRVRERATGRVLALKQLLPDRISTRALRRFLRECEVAGSLRHPGIVRVHSAGTLSGKPWLLTELVEGGRTLRTILDDPDTPRTQRLKLLLEVARAVGYAHEQGVVHRDLKPDNVLVGPDGRARLTDFGLAKVEDADRLTKTGALVGTPQYMAPEQITGEARRQGPACDVWALGAMLYQALSGELPFQCQTLHALSAKICNAQPPKLDPEVPAALQAVVARAMRKQPERRFASGAAFADALEAALREPQTPPPPPWLLPAVAGLALLGVLAVLTCALGRAGEQAPLPAVSLEQEEARTTRETLDLRGAAPTPDGWVEVRLGGEVRRVPVREGAFECVGLPLHPGLNTIQARLLPDGAPARLELERLAAPAWFAQQRERPNLPLPPGVVFGVAPGDYVNERDGTLLRWIPAGTYALGSDDNDLMPRSARRSVRLERGFFMGKFEVTWAQYERFCAETGRDAPGRHLKGTSNGLGVLDPMIRDDPHFDAADAHPVFYVSFEDAQAYGRWAGVELPSGVEWEVAAHGGRTTAYPWGNRRDPSRANMEAERDGHLFLAPVGSFPSGASPSGCLDMIGNVAEWTTDYAPGKPQFRVARGGAWNVSFDYGDTTLLEPQVPERGLRSIGFRVLRRL